MRVAFMITTLLMGVMDMFTIGLLTAMGLAVGASFGKALGVAVGSYFTACILMGITKGALRK
ncbi:hypothetical protein PFPBOIHM_00008 [Aeromonas phage avDM11-UST]|nr:hypothetical protein PFPBOIHM_00008 [Aeromonas phage avDM11-UST]